MRLSSFVMWALASTASAIAIREPSPVVVDREVSSPGASELYNELKNLAVRDIEDTFKREASTDLALIPDHPSALAARQGSWFNFGVFNCRRANPISVTAYVVAAKVAWDQATGLCKVWLSNKDFKYDITVRLSNNNDPNTRQEVTVRAATCNSEYSVSFLRDGSGFKLEVGGQSKPAPSPPGTRRSLPANTSENPFHKRRLMIGA
ncbi:hypothetical protein HER10_EVM0012274 [Colletotrichum scovillei]|uniref:Secreted protein n=1 Tax=Colletotrichum scovillei TaxID=1209932 RepID=A0A9P7U9C5_9PEZI|nr:uncharacterized protein HER10_EVM0012274 [Colletotrichum scovillei]KAF4781468.1 hypothetical protein HER10_EVM0012274 [Colletotrichum scovillei]KAG7045283.1 hypothetical protein JMJ77_0009367 [Colletotrichum scovillei]KAG7052447.1 hypothetical protein JMJ78_0005464 [Colletotrichum scovillei]KAG7064735.1 hypothetical protein JMJ76_0012494 [Colletotrichum scovillei]